MASPITFILKRQIGISIMTLTDPNANIAAEVKKWQDLHQESVLYYTQVTFLPNDVNGYFREAYDHDNTQGVFIDMVKARVIHMNNLRAMRDQRFIDLGFPQQLNPMLEAAITDATTKSTLDALRNMPQTYDLSTAQTPDQLRQMIPPILSTPVGGKTV